MPVVDNQADIALLLVVELILSHRHMALLVVVMVVIHTIRQYQVRGLLVAVAPVDIVEMVVLEGMMVRHQVTTALVELVAAVVLPQMLLSTTTFLVVEEVLVSMEKAVVVLVKPMAVPPAVLEDKLLQYLQM